MRKVLHRIVAVCVVGALVLGSVGCGSREKVSQEVGFSIWTTYNTRKVIQQSGRNDSYEKLPAELSVQMMQGEKEGTQLIITADRNMTYTLTAAELKNEDGESFPVENIEIFQQKYIQISNIYNGNPNFSAGDSIPDMLLPMQTAIDYEENTIEKGNNQGITVEFNSVGIAPGVYTGEFTLDIDGEETLIPANVEVWDIEYTGRRSFQSSFLIYANEMLQGEYDTKDETIQAYADKLLDYKINPMIVNYNLTVEEWLAKVKDWFGDENYNSIWLPSWFQLGYKTSVDGVITAEAEKALTWIIELAKASTEETPYIEYAYVYVLSLDEADAFDFKIGPAWDLLRTEGELDKTLELAVSRLKAEGWFGKQTPEFAARVERAILNIPAVFTNSTFRADWLDGMHAVFCPIEGAIDETSNLQQVQESALNHGNGKMWTYSCIGPKYPFPSFHVDDDTRTMRMVGWMAKSYDITGYLYYEVNNYTAPDGGWVDVYSDAQRFNECYGDGYLLYPGKYYNSSSPFASLRLTAYRDSMDDYDMLCVYESLLQEYAAQNQSEEIEFGKYVQDLYDSMFKGFQSKEEDALIYEARETLAKRILSLKNGEIPKESEEGQQRKVLTNFATDVDGVTVNQKSSVEQGANGTAQVTIRSEYKDKGTEIGNKTQLFRPYVTIETGDLSKADTIYFDCTNTGSSDLLMQIELVMTSGEKKAIDSSFIAAGKTRTLRVHFWDDIKADLADVSQIRLSFDNVDLDENNKAFLLPDKTFCLSDFELVLK